MDRDQGNHTFKPMGTATPLRVAVALSSGVDSSVSALLLLRPSKNLLSSLLRAAREGGWRGDGEELKDDVGSNVKIEVQGVHMSNWREHDNNYCLESSSSDYDGVLKLSDRLSRIKASSNVTWNPNVLRIDGVREYWNYVFSPLLEGMERNASTDQFYTPNPDMLCNRHVKFDFLKSEVRRRLGSHVLATGHYARILGGGSLAAGVDHGKDQSYFLAMTKRDCLDGVVFPLGEAFKNRGSKGEFENNVNFCAASGGGLDLASAATAASEACSPVSSISVEKHTTREIASMFELPNHLKRDSTGICFVEPKVGFNKFISQYTKIPAVREGVYKDVDTGEVVGK